MSYFKGRTYTDSLLFKSKMRSQVSALKKNEVNEKFMVLHNYLSMAIQPLYIVGRTPWTGDQAVARPLPEHRTTQTQNERIQCRHPSLEWDWNPRSQCSSGRKRFMP
jgi:hypothetical protein